MKITHVTGGIASATLIFTGAFVLTMSKLVMKPLVSSAYRFEYMELTKDQTLQVSNQTITDLVSGRSAKNVFWPIDNETPFYSPLAVKHLDGVAGSIRILLFLFAASIAVLVMSTLLNLRDWRAYAGSIAASCKYLLITIVSVCIALLVLCLAIGFDGFWGILHATFIPGGQFIPGPNEPADTLILLYPGPLWMKFCLILGATMLISTVLVWIVCSIPRLRSSAPASS